jgi:hypothetical protein
MLTIPVQEERLRSAIRSGLRTIVYWDEVYAVHVGRCLETGSVATADSAEAATEILNELLDDEVAYAVQHANLGNLFSSPASLDVWEHWMDQNERKQ